MTQIPVKELIECYLRAQRQSKVPYLTVTRNETAILDFFEFMVNCDYEINVFDKRKGRG